MAEYSPENYLASLLTTPQQEAEHLRASRSRQRVLAFADALRHIGNIYNTSKGAPAQQFNDPVTQERNTYKQEKLLRDANNMKYFTYQQAKAKQDADIAAQQWRQQTDLWNRMYKERDYDLRLGAQQWKQKADAMKLALDEAYKNRMIDINQYNAESSRIRALRTGMGRSGGRGMSDYNVDIEYVVDDNGKWHVVKKKRTTNNPTGGSANAPWVNNGGNGGGSSAPWLNNNK